MSKPSVGVRLFGHGSVYTLGIVLMRAGNFLLLPLYTALLTTAEYGAVGAIKQIAQVLVSLSLCGFGAALLRMGTRDELTEEQLGRITGTLVTFCALLALAMVIVGGLSWIPLHHYLGDLPLWPMGVIALSWVPTTAIFQLSLSSLQQRELPRKYTILNLSRWVFLLLFVGIFLVGLRWGAVGLLLAISLSSAAGAYFAVRSLPETVRFGIDRDILRRALAYGLPVVPHALSWVLLQTADRVILAGGPGLADVGRYTLAANLASIVMIVDTGLNKAWAPFFLRQDQRRDEEGWAHVRRLSFFAMAAVSAVCLLVSYCSPLLIAIASNKDYASAAPVVSILCLTTLVNAFFGVVIVVAYAEQKSVRWLAAISVPAALLNISLNLLWVPLWGMEGAALATLVCSALSLLGGLILSRHTRKVPFKYWRGLILLVSVAGLMWLGMEAGPLERAALMLAYVAGVMLLDGRDILAAARSVIRMIQARRGAR